MRKLIFIMLAQGVLVLAGCGGGSGSGTTSSSPSNNGSGSGGGGSGTGGNTVAISVDAGPSSSSFYDVDTPFITVTVCSPGSSSNCQQIDHVEVDTGSYGLRIISSVLNPSLASSLQPEQGPGGNAIVECTQFVDGVSWGPVKYADVRVAGESASGVPIQVIGDPSYESEIPSACSSIGTQEDTVAKFGANGIIGLGEFASDCGNVCATVAANTVYYSCPANGTSATSCANAAVSESSQVTNPVVDFQTDNNGVIVQLASVPDPNGAATGTGTLTFGIDTQSNNGLGGATVLTASASTGDISTTYNGTRLPDSYLDTGSNAYYFDASTLAPSTLPDCPSSGGSGGSGGFTSSWLCPTSEQTLSLQNAGKNGTISSVSIRIYNANSLFATSNTSFDDLGADSGSQSSQCGSGSDCYFDFGLPFFFGRKVYIAIAGANTSGGAGPYFAY